MIHEGHKIAPDAVIEADAIVIGSGAGGTVVATELAEAGRRVAILEEGGYFQPGQLNQREDQMFALLMGRKGPAWSEDYAVTFAYAKGVGGSTLHYWADSFPPPEDRVEKWAREFKLRDFSLKTLEPHIKRTGEKASIRLVPDEMVNPNNQKFAAAAKSLGWSAPRIHRAERGCVGSGFCQLGCSYAAKGLGFTYLPRGLARGLEVYADCRVEKLAIRHRRVTEAIGSVINRETGKALYKVRARAKLFVVACGGLGSPYLLLRSGFRGATGKTLYWNPHAMVYCLYDEPVYSYAGVPCAHHLDEFRLVRTGGGGGYKEGGFTALCGFSQPGGVASTVSTWGDALHRLMDSYHHLGGAVSVIDDEEPGTVTVDRRGRRVIDAWLGPKDKRKMRDYFKKMAKLFLTAGAREVYLPDVEWTTIRSLRDIQAIDQMPLSRQSLMLGAAHLMGTCPMGEDPSRSVVNSYCRSHEIANLFVADASALPTSVSVDPSWTVMTIASRAADYIANDWTALAG